MEKGHLWVSGNPNGAHCATIQDMQPVRLPGQAGAGEAGLRTAHDNSQFAGEIDLEAVPQGSGRLVPERSAVTLAIVLYETGFCLFGGGGCLLGRDISARLTARNENIIFAAAVRENQRIGRLDESLTTGGFGRVAGMPKHIALR